jgi:taurine dioxygenase
VPNLTADHKKRGLAHESATKMNNPLPGGGKSGQYTREPASPGIRAMNRPKGFEVRALAGAVGAEIEGIDLGGPLPAETVAGLRSALLSHGVIFFHGQDLPPERFLAAARLFGSPVEYPFVKGIEGFPEIIPVLKEPHERVNFGGVWHTDTAYLEAPPMATLLVAREVPPAGGDTLFASQTAAFAALSPGLRHVLRGLTAVNSSAKADVSRTREDRVRDSGRADARKEYVAAHPVVRRHPETGAPALYVNPAHTVRFTDMTEAESAGLLAFLFEHQVRPEFTCRFRWRSGSVAIWDNRCTLHNPVNDYHGHRRLMHRITLAGETPAAW